MATKFHINNNGEAKACHAKVKCRFGGASGQDNHFPTLAAAEKASQDRFVKIYGNVSGGVRKADLSSDTKAALARLHAGGMKVQRVESVASGKLTTPSATASDVAVTEERPDKELLAAIRRGDFKNAF